MWHLNHLALEWKRNGCPRGEPTYHYQNAGKEVKATDFHDTQLPKLSISRAFSVPSFFSVSDKKIPKHQANHYKDALVYTEVQTTEIVHKY